MATEMNADNQAKYQRLKDACDAFLDEVQKSLAFVEYPKWVDGTIVRGPEDEARLRAAGEPGLQSAPEAEARPAVESRTKK